MIIITSIEDDHEVETRQRPNRSFNWLQTIFKKILNLLKRQ